MTNKTELAFKLIGLTQDDNTWVVGIKTNDQSFDSFFGFIYWHPRSKRYAFWPDRYGDGPKERRYFDQNDLKQIADFLAHETKKHGAE